MARPHPAHIITDDSAIGGKIIEKSVRLNEADNAYFNRTSTVAGDRRTFTLSGWFKFYEPDDDQVDFIWMCGDSPSNQLQVSREGVTQINFEPKTGGSTDARFYTKSHFRGNSWYHLVLKIDTTQSTASDRMAFYINGVQDNEDTDIVATTYPSQNLELKWGENSISYVIGRRTHSGYEGNANMQVADLHYVSGYGYDATAFGYFDDQTGIWRPKKYTGSYGNAGWHLEFKDNSATTATTLGLDSSGNGNNFTPNNISTHDILPDTPTNVFATWNHNDHEGRELTLTEGNLKVYHPYQHKQEEGGATLAFSSGKWYWEEYLVSSTDDAGNIGVGVKSVEGLYANGGNHWRVRGNGGESDHNGTQTNIGTTWTTGDIIGIAVDMDAGTWTVSKNGTFVGSNIHTNLSGTVVPVTHNSNGGENHTFIVNFGQDSSFAGTKTAQTNKDASGLGNFYYPVPSGYKALCSKNLPPNVSSIIRPQRHHESILYTGNGGTSQTISGLEFKPDLIWFKGRNHAAAAVWIDSVRGVTKNLRSNSNAQEGTTTAFLQSFNEDGFTVGQSGTTNGSSETNIAYCWKAGGAAVSNTDGSITTSCSANQEAGFSIITYTGTGSQTTVGHGLGKAPKVMITKLRDTTTQDWFFNPGEITGTRGKYIKFNTTDAEATDAHTYPDVAPTSTVYTVGGNDGGNGSNGNGYAYVAYCWAEIPGYSKFGKYVGNDTTDGGYVHLGFRPAWIMIRKIAGEDWIVYDNKRATKNPVGRINGRLYADLASSESSSTEDLDILSTGFKLKKATGIIQDGSNPYIYMAFAEQPGLTPYGTFPNAR